MPLEVSTNNVGRARWRQTAAASCVVLLMLISMNTQAALVGEWRLDEASWNGTAGEVVDNTGNGLNGVRRGTATPAPARVCNGASLNGNSDYLEVADNALLDISNTLTVMTWIRPDVIPGSGLKSILSKDENYEFHINSSGNIYWWWQNSANTVRTLTSSGATLTAGNWYHIAIVYDNAGSQKIYINGVERASSTRSENLINNNDPLHIGADQFFSGREFDGLIDEVRIYNTALNAAAVNAAMGETRSCAGHFAISHDGNASSCDIEPITISRHDNSHVVDASYTDAITLSTSTGNGTWSLITGSGSFTNLGGGNASYAYAAGDGGQVVLGLANSVAETLNINVSDGSVSEDPSEDANLVFASSGSATFLDTFAAQSYSGNDGSNNWSGSWVEIRDNASPASGDIRIHDDGSVLWLELRGDGGGGMRGGGNGDGVSEQIWREADLSGFPAGASARLSFDYRRIELDNSNDYVTIEVSGNGGASWSELGRFSGRANDSAYTAVNYDISAYMAANTRIRFASSPRLGRNDRVYIDNVQIAVSWAVACPGTDHFVVAHDGLGIHCLAEPVSVTARLADGSTDTGYTGTITLDTQSGSGSWTLLSGNGVFADAVAGDGLATYNFDASDNGVASFNLDYRSGTASIDVDVYDGVVRDDDSEGNLLFSASGFTVTASALSNPPPGVTNTTIPAQTAANNFPLYLAAYGTTPTDPSCGIIETYTGNKNLKFWSSYINPGTGTLPVSVNSLNAFASEAAANGGSAQAVSFTNGQAVVMVNYADVGQITLAMKDDTVSADLPTGIRGASDAFVVKPADFLLSAIQRSSDGLPNPGTAVDQNGVAFMAAGADFSVTATAVNALGAATPNYGQENVPESILLTPTLVAAGAANNPAIAFTSGFVGFSSGVATGTDFRWGEVGIITLTPSVSDGDYLGGGDVTGTPSANVGRFYPDHFITSISNGSFANTCTSAGAFTYLGEGFGYLGNPTMTAVAQSAINTITANYTGTWAKLGVGGVSLAYPVADNSQLDENGILAIGVTSTAGMLSRTDNANGSLTFILGGGSADGFSYDRSAGQVSPFISDLSIALTAVSDGEASASDTPRTITPVGNLQRFGRGYAQDAYGTMSRVGDSLTIPIGSWYFNASGTWTLNTDDSCSSYTYSKVDTSIAATAVPASAVSLNSGIGDLTLTLANAGNPGGSSVITTVWPTWLQYDYDGVDQFADSNLYDDNPSATATFGIFRGDDRYLYWREAP